MAKEIKEKTIDELKELILEAKKELFTLKMGHNKLKQLENKTGFYKKTFKRINKQTHMINEELETYIYDENITNSLLNTIINSLH